MRGPSFAAGLLLLLVSASFFDVNESIEEEKITVGKFINCLDILIATCCVFPLITRISSYICLCD